MRLEFYLKAKIEGGNEICKGLCLLSLSQTMSKRTLAASHALLCLLIGCYKWGTQLLLFREKGFIFRKNCFWFFGALFFLWNQPLSGPFWFSALPPFTFSPCLGSIPFGSPHICFGIWRLYSSLTLPGNSLQSIFTISMLSMYNLQGDNRVIIDLCCHVKSSPNEYWIQWSLVLSCILPSGFILR